MDTNNGAEKLIASILEEARADAAAIEWKSTEDINAVRRKLEADKEALRDEFTQKASRQRELTLATARTNAELTGRKRLLVRKRALIDEAYAKAYKRIAALDGEGRAALLKRLLERECEGGETVCPAEKDLETVCALIEGRAVSGVSVGEADPSITDGFIIKGSNYVKNCSFDALMEEVRQLTSAKAAELLFN